MTLTESQLEPGLCNFVSAARAVQQTHAEFNAACLTTDADSIKLAYNMRESALDLLVELSPYDLVSELLDATSTIYVW